MPGTKKTDLFPSLPDVATIPQVMEATQLSERTLRKWIAEGVLPAYRLGGKAVRIRREDLEAIATRVRSA